MKLLVADDEKELCRALESVLTRQGYSVNIVNNGSDALSHGLCGDYDGIILDVMMPAPDGLEVLRQLRENGVLTPVILLTARSEVEDRVAGLDAGADDYLPKPFAMSELLARVRAMLRRKGDYTGPVREFCGLTLDTGAMELKCAGGTARLSGREFRMMEMLIETPRSIISTDQFIEHIWGWDSDVDVSSVWVNISNIRKKLASINAPVSIRATRGVGYSLDAV